MGATTREAQIWRVNRSRVAVYLIHLVRFLGPWFPVGRAALRPFPALFGEKQRSVQQGGVPTRIAGGGTGKIFEEPVGKGTWPVVQDAKLAGDRELGWRQVRSAVNC